MPKTREAATRWLLAYTLVILSVTEGGVRDLLYLPFHIGAKRRSTKINAAND
jgi:hypothetical protein